MGKLVATAIKHYDASKNKILIVHSFTATPNEILAEFEKQTQAKWDVSHASLDNLKQGEEKAWAKEDPLATAFTLRRIWTEGGTLYDRSLDNGVIGEPKMETLADIVRQAIEKQMKG